MTQFEVDPSSTSQNLFTALRLLLQAMKSVPVFTYISFALSLVFLLLYLNPIGLLLSSSSSQSSLARPQQRRIRKSEGAN